MRRKLLACTSVLYLASFLPSVADEFDIAAFFTTAMNAGRSGLAEKTRPVDARSAVTGEVVVTVIRSEGVETKSKPAGVG